MAEGCRIFSFWNFLNFCDLQVEHAEAQLLHKARELQVLLCQCRNSQGGNYQGSTLQSWHLSPTTFSVALGKESRVLFSDFISSADWRCGKASVK